MSRNRPLALVATAVVATIGLVGGVAFASHDFDDVPADHPFHDDISWMAENDIANGFPDGGYRPGEPVTRQAMAAFMRRLAGGDPAVDPVVDAATTQGRTAQQLGTTVRANEVSDITQVPESGSVEVLTLTLGAGTWKLDFTVIVASNASGVEVLCTATGVDGFLVETSAGNGTGAAALVTAHSVSHIVSTGGTVSFSCFKVGSAPGTTRVEVARAYATKIDTFINPSP